MSTYGGSRLNSFRFVHAADLHIDSPFKGLRDVDERVAGRLQSATYDAFRNLIRLCIDEQAAFLVIAGDVYDAEDRGIRAQVRFRDGLAELAGHGIETFVVHGNHDPLDGWRSAMSWPDKVHIFGPEPEWKVAHLATPSAGEAAGIPVAMVQGMSYATRDVTDNISLRFTPPTGRELFTIGLLHCNVGGNAEHANYAPCTVADLVQTGVDYWALGHVHTRQTLRDARRSGLPHIAYPGNTQGRHPNEAGARGCLLVEVGSDRLPRAEFRPLDVVRWEVGQVDITGVETIDAMNGAVRRVLDNLGARAEGRDVVCRVVFTGRGSMHSELAREGALTELLGMARAEAGPASPWVWVERMVDETRPELDLSARAKQDDFLGAVLRRGGAMTLESEGLGELAGLLSEVYGNRRNGLEMPALSQIAAMAEESRWKLAEVLEPEE